PPPVKAPEPPKAVEPPTKVAAAPETKAPEPPKAGVPAPATEPPKTEAPKVPAPKADAKAPPAKSTSMFDDLFGSTPGWVIGGGRCGEHRRELARDRLQPRRSRQHRHGRSRSDCRGRGLSRVWPRRAGR